MAPEAPNQKRKRGRPSITSKNKEGASGRVPRNRTANDDEESQHQQTHTLASTGNAMERGPEQKKRGRPRKSLDGAPPEENAPPTEEQTGRQSQVTEAEGSSNPRKRGRSARNKEPVVETNNAPEDPRPQKRRRGAPAAEQTTGQDNEEEPSTAASKSKKAAGRPAKKTQHAADEPEHEEAAQTGVRRGKRDRRPPTTDTPAIEPPNRSTRSNTSRSSLREVSITEAQNRASPENDNPAPKKRGPGRPSLNSNSEASSSKEAGSKSGKETARPASTSEGKKGRNTRGKSDEVPQPAATKEKGTKEKSTRAPGAKKPPQEPPQPNATKEKSTKAPGAKKAPQEQPPTQKRKPARPSNSASNEPPYNPLQPKPTPRPKYRHLAASTHKITRSTIAKKWSPLDDPSIQTIDSIIADSYRPILLRLRDREARQAQARTALDAFARRLHGKLVKGMPFPPPVVGSSHESELDFDKCMGAIEAAQATLDPLLHSVGLLKREKEREELALEGDYKALKRLRNSAKAEGDMWREKGKRMHVLVPEGRGKEKGKDRGGEVGDGELGERRTMTVDGMEVVRRRRGEEGGGGGLFKGLADDDELTVLAQRVGSHMKSMQSNLKQIHGILPAITQSKSSLQGLLHKYLDPQQYEQVIFG